MNITYKRTDYLYIEKVVGSFLFIIALYVPRAEIIKGNMLLVFHCNISVMCV